VLLERRQKIKFRQRDGVSLSYYNLFFMFLYHFVLFSTRHTHTNIQHTFRSEKTNKNKMIKDKKKII